jgi:enamine deaminase RidA (YjgF/YER057c/UK114 family)
MFPTSTGADYQDGMRCFKAGEYVRALEYFERAIQEAIDSDTDCMVAISLAVDSKKKVAEIQKILREKRENGERLQD